MPGLREQLRQCLAGRVCLMGLGNTDYGDDGFGVRLAEELLKKSEQNLNSEFRISSLDPVFSGSGFRPSALGFEILIAGTTPERFVGRVAEGGFNHLIFLDAVEFGGAPGSVVFLNSQEMAGRFPQVSTHKLSLGLLAKWVVSGGTTRAWLLGAQPESLRPGAGLTPAIRKTLDLLAESLNGMLASNSAQSATHIPLSAIA
jgi:hydrogenase 3 maturation protease